jgi:uncharacterized membrane protein YbhN (UPF0104 family)
MHVEGLRYFQLLRWNWIGEFFSLIAPGASGAELARGYYAFRNAPDKRWAAISTILIDRVLGLWSLLVFSTLSFLGLMAGGESASPEVTAIGQLSALACLGLTAGILGLFWAPLRRLAVLLVPRRLKPVMQEIVGVFGFCKSSIVISAGIALAGQLFLLAPFYLSGLALGTEISPTSVMLCVPLIFVSLALPISPGGIGVGEAAAAFLFAQFGIAQGAAIMLQVRLWTACIQLFGGPIYLFHRDRQPMDGPEEDKVIVR